MNRIFLATHAHLASGIESSIKMLVGTAEHITFFDAYVDERNLNEELEKFFEKCEKEDIAILITDLLGGSVNNALTQFANRENTFLVTGINLAFVLELSVAPENNMTEKRLKELVEQSKEAFKIISGNQEEIQEEDIFD